MTPGVIANSVEEYVDLYKTQVAARAICENECDKWHEWMGDLMQQFRREAGISAPSLANRMELSRSYLAMLERGQRRWTERLIRSYYAAIKG